MASAVGAVALAAELERLKRVIDTLVVEAARCADVSPLAEAARCVWRTSEEIARLSPGGLATGRLPLVNDELEAIRRDTGDAISRIVDAADRLLALDFSHPETAAAAVTEEAIGILEACCVGDITNQRVTKAAGILEVVRDRVRLFAEACGDTAPESETAADVATREGLLFGPEAEAVEQAEIDRRFVRRD
jgi:hypothetical protein